MRRMLIVAGGLIWLAGCAVAHPQTRFSINPFTRTFTFYDSKDNKAEIKGFEFDPTTNTVKLEYLGFDNNASDVRLANVQQMLAVVEQQRAANEGLAHVTRMLEAIVGIAGDTIRGSTVNVDTPVGSGGATLGTPPERPKLPEESSIVNPQSPIVGGSGQ